MQPTPNQLISMLNLTILKQLSHYLQIIKVLGLVLVCLAYQQSVQLNSINQPLIEYFIQLQFKPMFMTSFLAKFLRLYAQLAAFSLLLAMLRIHLKMSSKSNSFDFQAQHGTLTLLCSSSSYHFVLLKFNFLHFLFHSKLPIHHRSQSLAPKTLKLLNHVSFQTYLTLHLEYVLPFYEAALDESLA